MLKRIDSQHLRAGMFITDLDCGWMDHPFIISKFLIKNDQQIAKIINAGMNRHDNCRHS